MMYKNLPPPTDFRCDGCTVPRLLKRLYAPYKDACRWHDWARRHLVHYGVLTVKEADWQFRAYLRDLDAPAWLRSITWGAVKLTRDKYRQTLPVPPRWVQYLKPRA